MYERALSEREASEQLFKDIPKLAKFAHWCAAPAILDRLQYVVVQLTNVREFRSSKSFFVAVFALEDVGRGIPLSKGMKFAFSDIYIKFMNEEERNRFAGHALRMFDEFLDYPHVATDVYQSSNLSARLVGLARYLVKFHPGPRRSVATQTPHVFFE